MAHLAVYCVYKGAKVDFFGFLLLQLLDLLVFIIISAFLAAPSLLIPELQLQGAQHGNGRAFAFSEECLLRLRQLLVLQPHLE